MFPAMFGFSLGISETYMTVLVKTLEVLFVFFFNGFLKQTYKTQMCSLSAVGNSEDGEGESRRAIIQNIFIQW